MHSRDASKAREGHDLHHTTRGPVGDVGAISFHVLLAVLVTLVLSVLLAAAVGTVQVERSIAAEIEAVSATAGRRLADPINGAIDAGIPFERLVGLEAFLASIVDADARIAFAVVTDMSGRVVAAAGASAALFSVEGPNAAGGLASTWHAPGLIASPVLIHNEGAIGYVFVGVATRPQISEVAVFVVQILLLLLACAVAVREIALALCDRYVQAPARAFLHMSRAIGSGDLTVSYEVSKDRPLGVVLDIAANRLSAVNRRLNDLLLTAFATRSGHFEPSILREIGDVVERLVRGLELPVSSGVRPRSLPVERTSRAAVFCLLVGEMLLLALWPALSLSLALDLGGLVASLYLPFLSGLLIAHSVARRAIALSAGPIAFTAGALLSASALVGVGTVGDPLALWAVRFVGGFGCGIAAGTLAGAPGHRLRGAIAAAIAGIGFGTPLTIVLGPIGATLVGAALTALAGIAGAQFLPTRLLHATAPARRRRDWHGRLMPIAAYAAVGSAFVLCLRLLPQHVSDAPGSSAVFALSAAVSLLVVGTMISSTRSTRLKRVRESRDVGRAALRSPSVWAMVIAAACLVLLEVPELAAIPAFVVGACFAAMICTTLWATGLRLGDVSTAYLGGFVGSSGALLATEFVDGAPLGLITALLILASGIGGMRR